MNTENASSTAIVTWGNAETDGYTAPTEAYVDVDWNYGRGTSRRPHYVERKASLSLEEIQLLKQIAKKDKKVRAVLKKFENYIDVEVEF